jgi:serine/threonine protein kinase
MTLAPGTRIGPYEVTAPLGEGGMGVVFRARDTQLLRDVALKLLPGHFAAEPDRLGRFQREAQVLASLNHPNIAQIYGFQQEQLGRYDQEIEKQNDGIRALIAVGRTCLDSIQELRESQRESLEGIREALKELRDAQASTGEKLNILISTVDRIIRHRNGKE